MNARLVQAYLAASQGFSTDRVIADPELNSRFIDECHRLSLGESITELNRKLLNLRKASGLAGLRRSKPTHFSDEKEYRFASEMAIRFLERRDNTSLDRIICNPGQVAEFDQLASGLAPGYSPLQYRWAALNLRKSSGLKPLLLSRVAPAVEAIRFRVREIDIQKIPRAPGLYLVFDPKEVLYVGETENLRTRLKKHLDHSDNKGLAHWMWEHGVDELCIEIYVLDDSIGTRVRKALELELIRSRQPVFNIQR